MFRIRPGARWSVVVGTACALAATTVHAGGGPENALLIVDPASPDAMYIANHYRVARDLPEMNVLFMPPGGVDFETFTETRLPALFGTLDGRGLTDHIDYVILPPGSPFFVSAPGLVDGLGCDPSPITRFASSSAYTLAYSADEILSGTLSVSETNRFFSTDPKARAFDGRTAWSFGVPSTFEDARRYLVGFMLGYSGPRGNTLDETIAMIDRSVAVDGTRPAGTFYFMKTADARRSNPRDPYFSTVISEIRGLGGAAEEIEADLPVGRHDALGVLTGRAGPTILEADMTLLPGSFADHLTSFAGRFDTPSQRKMSEWISRGASGTMGTVEEPCVVGMGYTWKFPHPRFHAWYLQGLSLGEALLRSVSVAPFHSLFYGDPLTRPFAWLPEVQVAGVPSGPAAGLVELVPTVRTGAPGAAIDRIDLLVDGVVHDSVSPGAALVVDTMALDDGYHDVRVIAHDDTPVASQGRWVGSMAVDNHGRSVTLEATAATGDLATVFEIVAAASGGQVTEIRLLHHGRVVAATDEPEGRFAVVGRRIGAGQARLVAVADFADGRRARSLPLALDIAFDGQPPEEPGAAAPVAFDHTVELPPGQTALVDLPGSDPDGDALVHTLVSEPGQADLHHEGAGWVSITPGSEARGTDSLDYGISDGTTEGAEGTITLRYCEPLRIERQPVGREVCPGDTVTLSVAALGQAPVYRWRRDGRPLPDETEPSLRFADFDPRELGTYEVVVRDSCGLTVRTVVSAPAALTAPAACAAARAYLPLARRTR